MDNNEKKRLEERLRYKWPVLFAENFAESVSEGIMIDVSSGGIAFICRIDENCPFSGQKLAMRFSIPHDEENSLSDMTSFTRTGRVLRVDSINASLRRIAIQFDEPLTLKPCEHANFDLVRSQYKKT